MTNMSDFVRLKTEENEKLTMHLKDMRKTKHNLQDGVKTKETEFRSFLAGYKHDIRNLQLKLREVSNAREDEKFELEKKIRSLQVDLFEANAQIEILNHKIEAINVVHDQLFPSQSSCNSNSSCS